MNVAKSAMVALVFVILGLGQAPGPTAAATLDLLDPDYPAWKARHSIVTVYNPENETSGTGVIVAERVRQEGWIAVLTAQHVTRDSAFAYVNLPVFENRRFVRDRSLYGLDNAFRGKVITEANTSDLSVVWLELPDDERVNWKRARDISIARDDQCDPDEQVYIIGDNSTVDPDTVFRATQGHVESRENCNINPPDVVGWGNFTPGSMHVFAADIYPGFSGGPVLDRRGRLIGITFAGGGNIDELPLRIAYTVSFERMSAFLSEILFGVQIPIVNRTSDEVRYKMIFDRHHQEEWRRGIREWSWSESGSCKIHYTQYSLEELGEITDSFPYAFDREETRPVEWLVYPLLNPSKLKARKNFVLTRYISYLDRSSASRLPGDCNAFQAVYGIHRDEGNGGFRLEWGGD